MKFIALVSTADRKLTRGTVYTGSLVYVHLRGMRITVYDNLGQWTTFQTNVFKPYKEKGEQ